MYVIFDQKPPTSEDCFAEGKDTKPLRKEEERGLVKVTGEILCHIVFFSSLNLIAQHTFISYLHYIFPLMSKSGMALSHFVCFNFIIRYAKKKYGAFKNGWIRLKFGIRHLSNEIQIRGRGIWLILSLRSLFSNQITKNCKNKQKMLFFQVFWTQQVGKR